MAARYNVTAELLRKACKRMGVPVPRQTHWSKIASGKRPRRLALPPGERLPYLAEGKDVVERPVRLGYVAPGQNRCAGEGHSNF